MGEGGLEPWISMLVTLGGVNKLQGSWLYEQYLEFGDFLQTHLDFKELMISAWKRATILTESMDFPIPIAPIIYRMSTLNHILLNVFLKKSNVELCCMFIPYMLAKFKDHQRKKSYL